jgi:Cu2+-exporting ATPase
LRVDAGAIVARLRERGLGLTILSGDRPSAVAPVAAALAVTDWQGGLAPAEKIARLAALKAAGRRVLMVGDGLNDAPALAAAHCSLSPVTAGALAQAQADAVFLGERLAPVAEAIDLARRARALMQANLLMAVAYNAIAVPLAVAGLLTPLIAAAAMSGSSILVTLNALRAGREHTRRSGGRMRQVFGAPLLPLAGQGVTCNVTDEGRAVASIGAE